MPKSRVDVVLRQRRGRLVHDQDARVVRERLGDLDALPVADRELADRRAHVEVADVERVQHLARALAHRAPVDRAEAALRRVAHEDVFGDRQLGEEQELLVDRRDAGLLRVLGRGEAVGLPSSVISPASGW